ncbi:MAG: T9SS type A sorting domain-containing protein [Siphonobacter sp.]
MKNICTYRFKALLFSILSLFIFNKSIAQQIGWVTFDKCPKDFQLYARKDDNTAEVPIEGRVVSKGWSYMSVITYRNGVKISYNRGDLAYQDTTDKATFKLATTIQAELADYSFDIYCCSATDSVLMTTRTDVVAGDFYLIEGQSNATASASNSFSSKYCRTLGRIPVNDNYAGQTAADTLWNYAGYSAPAVGYWGMELQRLILENDQIPTCVLNGSIPGTVLSYHIQRGNTSEEDISTIYGHLLYRVNKTQASRIRRFFYYQGEQDALEGNIDFNTYIAEFDSLHSMWQSDYSIVDEFSILQINILFNPYYLAGQIREFQRKTIDLYPKTSHFATIGLPGYDGVHYATTGYGTLAQRLYNSISPTVYNSSDSINVIPPNIQRVFYGSYSKDTLVLDFDTNQKIQWSADTTALNTDNQSVTLSLKNYFYLDGDETVSAPINGYETDGNRVYLFLKNAITATKLTYMPAYNTTGMSYFVGPYLKNERDLAAFTFQEFPIANPISLVLQDSLTRKNHVYLSWNATGDVSKYVLERKDDSTNVYSTLQELNNATTTFTDTGLQPDRFYTYRLKAFGPQSDSPYVLANVRTYALTKEILEAQWSVSPNPATQYADVKYGSKLTGTIYLYSLQGQLLYSNAINYTDQTTLDLSAISPGQYIVVVKTQNGIEVNKRIMKF